jgi:hypothetical protein
MLKPSIILAGIVFLAACKEKPDTQEKAAAADSTQRAQPASSNGLVLNSASVPDTATILDTVPDPLRAKIGLNCMALRELSRKFSNPIPPQADEHGNISEEAVAAIHDSDVQNARDSLKWEWQRLQDSTFNLINVYKKELMAGIGNPRLRPIMLAATPVTDSLSLAKLPKPGPSSFLKAHPFFFLGAGPFFRRPRDQEEKVAEFRDPDGNAEIRYCDETNSNTTRIMRMVRGFGNAPVTTIDGGPIGVGHHEEDSPLEKAVKGIGSITHVLNRKFPVYFITAKGLVEARLVQVTEKLFEAYQGCVSDLPEVCFGSSKLPPGEILGVYIPYEPVDIASCVVTRKRQVWSVDLTGDGAPEFAGVSTGYDGISGTINKVFWYGNVSGRWQMIDSAEDQDCT